METWSQIKAGLSEPNSKYRCDLKLRPTDHALPTFSIVYSYSLCPSTILSLFLTAVNTLKKYLSNISMIIVSPGL